MSHEERKPTKFPQEAEVPKHQKKAKKRKPYGIEYFSGYLGGWHNRTWYTTEKARDQALKDLLLKAESSFMLSADKPPRKVNR
jgi:hypothetical protein